MAVAILAALCCASLARRSEAQSSQGEGDVIWGFSKTDRAVVRDSPRNEARAVAYLRREERVVVLSQTVYWYKIRSRARDGLPTEGWIPKELLRLQAGAAPKAQDRSREATNAPSGSYDDELPQTFNQRVWVRFAPTYSLYRFGASQYRIAASYERSLGSDWGVGIPVGYDFGGGFSSFQLGGEGFYRMYRWGQGEIRARSGLLMERFSGNRGSFLGGTMDVGVGVVYRYRPRIEFYCEPASIEATMPIGNDDVKWFMRGQVMVGVGGAF